jgi:hypothetical protein
MQAKAVIQPKETARSEDVAYSHGGTRRFRQLDSLFLCNGVLELPPNLKVLISC